ncbi:MAG: FeoB-associated Cys-rich membrane protein [Cyclobacteriaceae bacterium]|nr:FeoB-associated Cys-rich membrane protein [Cyclobacteriaceae bacterium]
MQQLLIAALFLAALFYLSRMAWRTWRAKNTCEAGCGKCSAANPDVGRKPFGAK